MPTPLDNKTAQLFIVWFVLCIITTYTGVFPVANIAHGAGLALGAGLAVTVSHRWSRPARAAAGAGVAAVVALGLAGATVLRPYVNRSSDAARDNAYQGYLALESNRDADAARWLANAARMGPRVAGTWYNLGIAYRRIHRPTDAAAAFGRASQLEPGNAQYREAVAYATVRAE